MNLNHNGKANEFCKQVATACRGVHYFRWWRHSMSADFAALLIWLSSRMLIISARRPSDESSATIHRLNWGPLPPNKVVRIAQHVREEEGKGVCVPGIISSIFFISLPFCMMCSANIDFPSAYMKSLVCCLNVVLKSIWFFLCRICWVWNVLHLGHIYVAVIMLTENLGSSITFLSPAYSMERGRELWV